MYSRNVQDEKLKSFVGGKMCFIYIDLACVLFTLRKVTLRIRKRIFQIILHA